MPLSPQQRQQAQRAGAEGGGDVGLVAQPAHLQIGVGDLVRQLAGQGVVVVRHGVGQHQILPVGAEGATLREIGREAPVPPGIVQGAGVHDAQSEAPHLRRGKAALPHRGAAQGIHRVTDHAEQAAVVLLPRHARVDGRQLPVQAVLRHAHVPGGDGHVRHHAGGAEQEHVPVKELLRGDDVHRRQGGSVRGLDLVQLELPALRYAGAHVTDADGADHVAAQQPQPHQQGAAHVPQR